MRPQPVSQKDLAKILRLSTATISLALANHPRIPAATRIRVHAQARKMGYKINRNAVLLINQRWAKKTAPPQANIAYLQTPKREGDGDAYLPGLLKQAEALGYHLDVFQSWKFPSNDHITKILYNRGIRGVIVGQNNGNLKPYTPPRDTLAVVQCGLFLPVEIFTLVRPDLDTAVRLCFEKVRSRNFSRIGIILLKNPEAVSDRILETTIWDLKRIFPDNVEVFIKPWSFLQTEPTTLKEWFHRHKMDAVIGITPSVYHLLQEFEIKVPFACMVYDANRPQFDGANLQFSMMGEMSINLLDSYLRQNLLGMPAIKRIFMVEPTWHEGTSLSRRGIA